MKSPAPAHHVISPQAALPRPGFTESIGHCHALLRKLTPLLDIDEFFHVPHIVRIGETISSTTFERKAGGKGANQAYAVARAGAGVDLEGCIGTDGEWVREILKRGGVTAERVRTVEGEVRSHQIRSIIKLNTTVQVTGRAIIQSAEDGENSIGNFGSPDLLVNALI